MIVIATILCERKISSWYKGLSAALETICNEDVCYYVNIQSEYGIRDDPAIYDLDKFLQQSEKKYDLDYWSIRSSWMKKPAFDQDQARLDYIVIARNMALAYARSVQATHIFFVDADVIVKPNTLQILLNSKKSLAGGLVPGRGVHKHVTYIFGKTNIREGNLVKASHGTLGCMLIENSVFDYLSFRWGKPIGTGTKPILSEDPAYCNDAKILLGQDFWLNEEARCEHWDDPDNPLTLNAVSKF